MRAGLDADDAKSGRGRGPRAEQWATVVAAGAFPAMWARPPAQIEEYECAGRRAWMDSMTRPRHAPFTGASSATVGPFSMPLLGTHCHCQVTTLHIDADHVGRMNWKQT
ncbi:hypothetical protein [Nocardia sp. CNY236]|uniref:hypothetical protein n=1 Tax=Nocardia sp. CNY236 TaxID=1169152 RepID=UPI000404BDD0|nr:hypothetical protein [Nocardia sp. CNY236]